MDITSGYLKYCSPLLLRSSLTGCLW